MWLAAAGLSACSSVLTAAAKRGGLRTIFIGLTEVRGPLESAASGHSAKIQLRTNSGATSKKLSSQLGGGRGASSEYLGGDTSLVGRNWRPADWPLAPAEGPWPANAGGLGVQFGGAD